ncbi:hypothetical protein BDW69DRAFT_172611 [Aspergillus filifer]
MPICYNIHGNEDPSLFACSDDGHPAHCCARDQLCASNGLCVNGPSEEEPLTPYTVGGCTVQDFEVDTCGRCYQGIELFLDCLSVCLQASPSTCERIKVTNSEYLQVA